MTYSTDLTDLCKPRWATARNLDRKTYGPRVRKISEALKTPFMPWQQMVSDIALEVNPITGKLHYRTIIITVPRQSGKTTLLLSLMVHRALGFEGRQNIIYTAQTQKAARKKWEEEHVYALNNSMFKGMYKVRYTFGSEQIKWENGSRHSLTAPTEKAGHGETVDEVVIDEAFAQEDNRLEQALRPAMITRPEPQFYIISTAGTARSAYLREKVDRGRALVESGMDSTIAYFEWSAPDDADPASHETWYRCMPALGHTISIDAIQSDFELMELAEFRRAYLNQWSDEIPDAWLVITEQDWNFLADKDSTVKDRFSLGVDCTPERNFSSIVAAGNNQFGKTHIELTSSYEGALLDHRPGTSWVVPRLKELIERWNPDSLVIQPNGPAASFIPEILGFLDKNWDVKTKLELPSSTEYAGACQYLFDRVYDHSISHIGQSNFHSAFAAVRKMELSEGGWKWNRKLVSADISPVVAMTLAVFGNNKYGRLDAMQPWFSREDD